MQLFKITKHLAKLQSWSVKSTKIEIFFKMLCEILGLGDFFIKKLLFSLNPQIREQMSVPDLYVLTVAFLALKKTGFSKIENFSKIFFEIFLLYFMQLFSADATM